MRVEGTMAMAQPASQGGKVPRTQPSLSSLSHLRLQQMKVSAILTMIPEMLPLCQAGLPDAALHSAIGEQGLRVNHILASLQTPCFRQSVRPLVPLNATVRGHPMHNNMAAGHHNLTHVR